MIAGASFTLISYLLSGQAVGDYRTNLAGTWNWNAAANWQRCVAAGTWAGATNTTYPGQNPGAGTVIIRDGHNVTMNVSPANAIGALTIRNGITTTTLTIGNYSLNVTNATTITSNTDNINKSINVGNGSYSTGSISLNGSNITQDAFLQISGSGTVDVIGNVTMNSTDGSRNYILFTGNGTLNIGGSISGGIITSTIGGSQTAGPSSGTVIYNGTSAQAIGSYTYFNLTINNATQVSISANVTVNNVITMSGGDINTGTNTLIVSAASAGSLIRISGSVVGKIRRQVSVASADYLFPVGTSSFYRPATLNFSSISAGTDITAEFIATGPIGFSPYLDDISNLDALFSEGYWRFSSSSLPVVNYSVTLEGNNFASYTMDEASRISARDNANTTWRASGSHGTWSGSTLTRTGITTALNTTYFDFAFASGCIPTSLGYEYERTITFDHTRVAGGSDLHNFPVLINLTTQGYLETYPAGHIRNSSGYDIIFTDENYNQLDHQIEYYNGTNGDLIAWVRIPTLSMSTNTVIRMLYGNLQISIDQSVPTVWDSHYRGVWHLNDNNLYDFTSYGKAATPFNSPTYSQGTISNALGMNGTNQYAQVINAPNINFAGNVTISAWVRMTTRDRDQKIAGNQNNSSGGFKFGIFTNNKVEFEIRNSANNASLNRDVTGGTVLNTGTWYYLAGISSDVLDSIKTFVNGIPERPFKKTGELGIASNDLTIGKEPFLSNYYFSGRFDELRISDEVRSDGWLRTEYFNHSSPSTFYSIGTESTADNLPSESICSGPITLTFGFPAGGVYSGAPNIVGNVFTPPAAGAYTIIYTFAGNCGETSISKNFNITDIPAAPVAANQSFCSDQITYLQATTGDNIRWYYGGTLVSTANPFSTGQTNPGTYTYTVTQTVNGCEGSPATVTLTIYNSVSINTHPQPVIICDGNNTTFTVVPAGYNPTFRWQENGVNISDGGIYSGATTATLTLTNPGLSKNGRMFRCVVNSICGSSSVTSNNALLTVNPQPAATFSYPATPYCPNAVNPSPVFSGGGIAGTFSSTAGLVFVSTSTGQINIPASTPGSYTVTNTIAAAGGCSEIVASAPFSIVTEITWTGASGTDWNTPGNWSCSIVPTLSTMVQIPNVPNKPEVSSGSTGSVKNLTVAPGSGLTVSGTLEIAGNVSNNGIINATNGKIEYNGTVLQTISGVDFNTTSIQDLTINNAAGVTIQSSLKISGIVEILTGNLNSSGNLILQSTATSTALISGSGTGQIIGNVTMQRYLPSGFGYKYFSSPFQAATVGEFGEDMSLAAPLSFHRYNENRLVSGFPASGWELYNNAASILAPVSGYSINFGSASLPKTVDVTGVVNNGNISVTLYNNNQIYTKGMNLVGNPYPSPINWTGPGWTKTNIDNALYYFKASTTDQYGGTYSSWVNGISSDGVASNIIPSMQGFFVHVSSGSYPVTGTLEMNNNVRVTDMTQPFISKSGPKGESSLLRITAGFSNDPSSQDPLVIYLDDNATPIFDNQMDAIKFFNTDYNVPNFFSSATDGSRMSVNALPFPKGEIQPIPLGIRTRKNGEIIFRLKDLKGSFPSSIVYLYDDVTGCSTDLTIEDYRIILNTGDHYTRFFLKFADISTDVHIPSGKHLSIYASGNKLYADINCLTGKEGILKVHSLTGQTMFISEIYENGHHEFTLPIVNGIYIVSFVAENIRISQKIIIQY